MPLIGFNSQPNSGSTTCAKFTELPIISLTEEVSIIYNKLYIEKEDANINIKGQRTRSQETFVHDIFTQEDITHLFNNVIENATIRDIRLSIENVIRTKDPLYFVHQYTDIIKVASNLAVTEIKTSEEAKYLKELRPDLYILQIIRFTEDAGIYDGYSVDNIYIDKKVLNISSIDILENKIKTVMYDLDM